MSYAAPLKDMLFVMNELAELSQINALPGCEDATRRNCNKLRDLSGLDHGVGKIQPAISKGSCPHVSNYHRSGL